MEGMRLELKLIIQGMLDSLLKGLADDLVAGRKSIARYAKVDTLDGFYGEKIQLKLEQYDEDDSSHSEKHWLLAIAVFDRSGYKSDMWICLDTILGQLSLLIANKEAEDLVPEYIRVSESLKNA